MKNGSIHIHLKRKYREKLTRIDRYGFEKLQYLMYVCKGCGESFYPYLDMRYSEHDQRTWKLCKKCCKALDELPLELARMKAERDVMEKVHPYLKHMRWITNREDRIRYLVAEITILNDERSILIH